MIHETSVQHRNPQSLKITKCASELRRGDEIDAYSGGKTLKRCSVTRVRNESDRTHLTLKPPIGRTLALTFVSSTVVEVYGTTRQQERAIALAPVILDLLPELSSWSLAGIKTAYKERHGGSGQSAVALACELLTQSGQLIRRDRSGKPAYRRPLPMQHGLLVVELPGTKSERYGWIVGSQIMQSRVRVPLIRWVDGSQSVAPEERLEPLGGGHPAIEKIRIAQAVARGERPEGFVELSCYLCQKIAREVKEGRIDGGTLLAIADEWGWDTEPYQSQPWRMRNAILDRLELYHPSWKRGIPTFVEQQEVAV